VTVKKGVGFDVTGLQSGRNVLKFRGNCVYVNDRQYIAVRFQTCRIVLIVHLIF
jgi:hypothetical protein